MSTNSNDKNIQQKPLAESIEKLQAMKQQSPDSKKQLKPTKKHNAKIQAAAQKAQEQLRVARLAEIDAK